MYSNAHTKEREGGEKERERGRERKREKERERKREREIERERKREKERKLGLVYHPVHVIIIMISEVCNMTTLF